jgi:hypothetical protein
MLAGKKFTAMFRGDTLEGSVAKGCLQMGILLPRSFEAWLYAKSETHTGITVIQWGMNNPPQQNIPKKCLTASSGGYEYGTTVVW